VQFIDQLSPKNMELMSISFSQRIFLFFHAQKKPDDRCL